MRTLQYRPSRTQEMLARLSVGASVFSWLGVVTVLLWR